MSNARAIPMIDLAAQHAPIEGELRAAIERVMKSGRFILGPEVEAFERAIAQRLGVAHAIGCASGSDALVLSLLALGIGPGDEVLVPAFSFVATAEAVARVGARPVFLDIDPRTFDLGDDVGAIAARVTPKTRAIIPVHLFGQCMPIDPLRALGIPIIEDAAQAIGARDPHGALAGTRGELGVLSFFPTKNLGALGDGGMVLTSSDELAARVRALRMHGRGTDLLGMNSRLDALQAAMLTVKLAHLDRFVALRRSNAARYDRALGARAPFVRSGAFHVYNQYAVRVRERDRMRAALAAAEIGSAIYYERPLHREPCFQYEGPALPVAERASSEVLSLPIAIDLTDAEIDRVAAIVAEIIVREPRA